MMGMYTELVMNVGLKDIDADTARLLRAMIEHNGLLDDLPKPDHPLFSTPRWAFMLNSGSFYFVPFGASKFVESFPGTQHISIRTDFKNYDDEINLFADWIAPYVEDEFAGYKRYEEDDHPTLLYFREGKPVWVPVA